MGRLLYLTFGYRDGSIDRISALCGREASLDRVDTYQLDAVTLGDYAALLVSMHVDQKFLSGQAGKLRSFLEGGGTIVANGHHASPFLPGVSSVRPLRGGRVADLAIRRRIDHPIWTGVAENELTFRRGVAGFYGRGWHEPPPGATVIHTIGDGPSPVDFVFSVGAGRVLFHGGNDLWQYGGGTDTTSCIVPQLLAWLASPGQRP